MSETIRKGTRIQLVAHPSGRREQFAIGEAENVLNHPKNNGSWALAEHSKYQHVDGKIIAKPGTGNPPQS